MSGIIEQLQAELAELKAKVARLEAQPAEKLVTISMFASARSIGESTVRAAIRDGRLPSTKIGRAVRVPANAEIASAKPQSSTSIADRVFGVMRGGRP